VKKESMLHTLVMNFPKKMDIHHCEVNQIELVWAWMKCHVNVSNKDFKANEMGMLVRV